MSQFLIKILHECVGSQDGHTVKRFYKDQLLVVPRDITDTLARFFIRNGNATEIGGNNAVSQ